MKSSYRLGNYDNVYLAVPSTVTVHEKYNSLYFEVGGFMVGSVTIAPVELVERRIPKLNGGFFTSKHYDMRIFQGCNWRYDTKEKFQTAQEAFEYAVRLQPDREV